MGLKTLCRIGGVFDAAVWSYVGYKDYKVLSQLDYNKVGQFFMSDYPLEYKIGAGIIVGTEIVFVPIIALGIADGLVDIVKGYHHYLGMQVWRKITRNPKRREQLDKALEQRFE
jgi:hypothetical protein